MSQDITPVEFLRGAKAFVPSAARLKGLEAQRQRLAAKSVPFRVSFLDDLLFGILPIDLVLVGAETGAGKTTLASLFAIMAARRGLRVAYLALEAYLGEVEQRLLFQKMSQLAWARQVPGVRGFTFAAWLHGRCDHVADEVIADATRDLLSDLETLSSFYRGKDFGVDDIDPILRGVAKETDLFVFDHLHYVDVDDRDENRAMRKVLKSLSYIVNSTETPVIAIAHLRKKQGGWRGKTAIVPSLEEFHGTSDIGKIATKAITMAPAWDRQSGSAHIANTYMAVEKDRLDGRKPFCAILGFNRRNAAYENEYVLGKLSPDRSKFINIQPSAKPWWAENGKCVGTPKDAPEPSAQQEFPE